MHFFNTHWITSKHYFTKKESYKTLPPRNPLAVYFKSQSENWTDSDNEQ